MRADVGVTGPQCVARNVDGKRQVAGVHWDYDCYGAPGKIAAGRPAMMPNWDKDFEAGRTLLTMNGLPVFEVSALTLLQRIVAVITHF